jgi:TRAP-type mannitol/chloroaromatic compound transport system permease small subunit
LKVTSGKKTVREAFEDVTSSERLTGAIIFLIFFIFFMFAYAYGAAKLSWHYNMFIGNGSGSAYFWSIVCFFFSGFYYPFYGLFINPIASMRRNMSIVGGRMRA